MDEGYKAYLICAFTFICMMKCFEDRPAESPKGKALEFLSKPLKAVANETFSVAQKMPARIEKSGTEFQFNPK